jgi:hypothetical protein
LFKFLENKHLVQVLRWSSQFSLLLLLPAHVAVAPMAARRVRSAPCRRARSCYSRSSCRRWTEVAVPPSYMAWRFVGWACALSLVALMAIGRARPIARPIGGNWKTHTSHKTEVVGSTQASGGIPDAGQCVRRLSPVTARPSGCDWNYRALARSRFAPRGLTSGSTRPAQGCS